MKKDIGKRLKSIRENAGMTQQDVAQLLSIPRTRYTNYENGVSNMPDELLDIFVKHFGTSYDYIKGHSKHMVSEPEIQYGQKSLLELINLLEEGSLKDQIMKLAIALVEKDSEQKEKIITLHEYKDELLQLLKDANYNVPE